MYANNKLQFITKILDLFFLDLCYEPNLKFLPLHILQFYYEL